MQREARAISEFTFAGNRYKPGDAFRHDLPAIEMRGLVRTRLVELVPVGDAPAPPTAPAPPSSSKRKRARRAAAIAE